MEFTVCVDIEFSIVFDELGDVLQTVLIAVAAEAMYAAYLLRLWLRLRVFILLELIEVEDEEAEELELVPGWMGGFFFL